MRILPTICVHMCTVASVSCHSSRISSGQMLLGMIVKDNANQDHRPAVKTQLARDRYTYLLRRVIMLFMKLRLIVEKDPETGRYSSVFPELPGCASAGDTEEEAT